MRTTLAEVLSCIVLCASMICNGCCTKSPMPEYDIGRATMVVCPAHWPSHASLDPNDFKSPFSPDGRFVLRRGEEADVAERIRCHYRWRFPEFDFTPHVIIDDLGLLFSTSAHGLYEPNWDPEVKIDELVVNVIKLSDYFPVSEQAGIRRLVEGALSKEGVAKAARAKRTSFEKRIAKAEARIAKVNAKIGLIGQWERLAIDRSYERVKLHVFPYLYP